MHRTTLRRAMTAAGLAALAATATAPAAHATAVTSLFKTLNPATLSGVEQGPELLVTGEKTYFAANDGVHGQEVWVATANGATRLTDLVPGPDGSSPQNFTSDGSLTYFEAYDGGEYARLWVTEGTPATTRPAFPLADQPDRMSAFHAVGNDLYFASGDYLDTVHKVSGATGAMETLDLVAPLEFVENIESIGDTLFLSVYDFDTNRRHLAVGSGAGGGLLLDDSDTPYVLASSAHAVSGNTYFFVITTEDGNRILATDGTTAGTRVLDVDSPESISDYPDFVPTTTGKVAFRVGAELLESDGTLTTSQGLLPSSSLTSPVFSGGALFYGAESESGDGGFRHPLSGPGSAPTRFATGYVSRLAVSAGVVHFRSRDFDGVEALFKTDGTVAGTTQLTSSDEFPSNRDGISGPYATPGGGVLFAAFSRKYGNELFTAGAPGQPAAIVADVNQVKASGYASFERGRGVNFGAGLALFSVDDGVAEQPWISDGTSDGTQALLPPSERGRYVRDAVAHGKLAAFRLETDEERIAFEGNGTSLWITDGSGAGTTRLSPDAAYGAVGTNVRALVSAGGSVYYTARAVELDEYNRYGLFMSNGTAPGAAIPRPAAWPEYATVEGLAAVGDTVYYALRDREDNARLGLWTLDTKTGLHTQVSSDETIGFDLVSAVSASGKLYVPTYGDNGSGVWVSDGTEAGTLALDVEPSESDVRVYAAGTSVFAFIYNDTANERELSRIAGQALTPVETDEDHAWGRLDSIVSKGDAIYGIMGNELVRVGPDGPLTVVKALEPEPEAERWAVSSLSVAGGKLYFNGYDAEHGYEPWISDGTSAGTARLPEMLAGTGESYADGFFQAGNRVLFNGFTAATGSQLFTYGVPEPPKKTATPTPAPEAPKPTPAPPAAGPPAAKPDTRAVPRNISIGVENRTDKEAPYQYELSGQLFGAKGFNTKAKCAGNAEITVTRTVKSKGKKLTVVVATYKSRLRWVDDACSFERTITLPKKGLAGAGKVQATVRFRGTDGQQPKTGETITLRYG